MLSGRKLELFQQEQQRRAKEKERHAAILEYHQSKKKITLTTPVPDTRPMPEMDAPHIPSAACQEAESKPTEPSVINTARLLSLDRMMKLHRAEQSILAAREAKIKAQAQRYLQRMHGSAGTSTVKTDEANETLRRFAEGLRGIVKQTTHEYLSQQIAEASTSEEPTENITKLLRVVELLARIKTEKLSVIWPFIKDTVVSKTKAHPDFTPTGYLGDPEHPSFSENIFQSVQYVPLENASLFQETISASPAYQQYCYQVFRESLYNKPSTQQEALLLLTDAPTLTARL